jgi:hypothetical protein
VDGQILQLKMHLGEFAQTGVLQKPLILLGSVTPMCVRVDVDENDAWRVRSGAAATGYLRGNKDINVPLRFVRFEPYVIPKASLVLKPEALHDHDAGRVVRTDRSRDAMQFKIDEPEVDECSSRVGGVTMAPVICVDGVAEFGGLYSGQA